MLFIGIAIIAGVLAYRATWTAAASLAATAPFAWYQALGPTLITVSKAAFVGAIVGLAVAAALRPQVRADFARALRGDIAPLAGLTRLIELRAMHNRLAGVPALPPSLRELHLRGNDCVAVPPAVQGLPELRILDLRANRLSGRLPSWLAELPRLEKLDLRWNSFDDPPVASVPPGCVVLVE